MSSGKMYVRLQMQTEVILFLELGKLLVFQRK